MLIKKGIFSKNSEIVPGHHEQLSDHPAALADKFLDQLRSGNTKTDILEDFTKDNNGSFSN